MKFFDKTWKLALSGAVAGLLVALLAIYGNPANMAICVACFIRDSAGALKLHTAAPVQYFRPEIVGFVCGSFLLALLTKEYKSTAGSSPMVRFILGTAMMIGALVFLGCPLRMVLRMSAGDLNAWVALIGFAGGVATGSFFLKKGFSLGRAYEAKPLSGAVLPVLLAALLVIGTATGVYAMSTEGPGSKHAPAPPNGSSGIGCGVLRAPRDGGSIIVRALYVAECRRGRRRRTGEPPEIGDGHGARAGRVRVQRVAGDDALFVRPDCGGGVCARSVIGMIVLLPVIAVLNRVGPPRAAETPEERRKGRKTLVIGGVCCGTVLCIASCTQQFTLLHTTVGKAGFMTACYILVVPLLGLLFGRRCGLKHWCSVAIALADTGSPEVQVAILTARIKELTEHLKAAPPGAGRPALRRLPEPRGCLVDDVIVPPPRGMRYGSATKSPAPRR